MKSQVFIITAYKDPMMLQKLLEAVHDRCWCYVHMDKRAWKNFEYLTDIFKDVAFYSLYSVNWGSYEHLMAIIHLLKCSLENDYTYAHIISGEEYLIRPVEEIEQFFNNTDKIYCQCSPAKKGDRRRRWYRYYWPYTRFQLDYKNKLVRKLSVALAGIQACIPFINKKAIGNEDDIFGGIIWTSYPKNAIKHILDHLDRYPCFLKALRWCKLPEELCFQTILMNSDLGSKITGNNKRYSDFKRGDGASPIYLDIEDIEEIDSRGDFFVRKVRADSKLVEYLEKRVNLRQR